MRKFYALFIALLTVTLSASAQHVKTRKAAQRTVTELTKPVVKPATDITNKGFTAHWDKVDGAEGYSVMVYSRTVADSDSEYAVLDEDFAGITEGSLLEPLGGDEEYVNLDDYSFGENAGWSAYAFPNFVPSMVAGLLYSPYLNLTNDGGRYRVVITTYSSDGDVIQVVSHGKGEKVTKNYNVSIAGGGTGLFTQSLEFENGSEDVFFTVINLTADAATTDYTDRVQVFQNLKKGDVYYKLAAIDESIPAVNDFDIPVTAKTFTDVTVHALGDTTFYYRVAAGAYNFYYDDDNKLQYDYRQSPYSDYVKVELASEGKTEGHSETEEPETPAPAVVENGTLTLGHFNETLENESSNSPVAYDGNNWYNAPMTFAYRNSGSQNLYLPEELEAMKGQYITSVSFSCFGDQAYYTQQYSGKAKIYLSEVDDTEFHKNEGTGDLEWFALDNNAQSATAELNLDFFSSTVNGEDIVITFDLSQNPFKYTGKTLLLTIANESDQCLDMTELVRFNWIDRKEGDKPRSCVFANDNIDFMQDLAANNRISSADSFEGRNDHVPAVRFTYTSATTAVDNVAVDARRASDNAWYTLQGVRVSHPSKGLYIHNGRKVLVK